MPFGRPHAACLGTRRTNADALDVGIYPAPKANSLWSKPFNLAHIRQAAAAHARVRFRRMGSPQYIQRKRGRRKRARGTGKTEQVASTDPPAGDRCQHGPPPSWWPRATQPNPVVAVEEHFIPQLLSADREPSFSAACAMLGAGRGACTHRNRLPFFCGGWHRAHSTTTFICVRAIVVLKMVGKTARPPLQHMYDYFIASTPHRSPKIAEWRGQFRSLKPGVFVALRTASRPPIGGEGRLLSCSN